MIHRWTAILLVLLAVTSFAVAAAPASGGATIELKVADPTGGGAGGSTAIRLVILFTILSVAPMLVLMMTCFVRIIIAMHFLRQALGTPQMPPSQVIIGLSLFLTFFVMSPVLDQIHQQAWVPYSEGKIDAMAGLTEAGKPLQEFMLKNTRQSDLALFVKMAKIQRPSGPQDLPMRVVVPAFMISELRTGFEIGFLLFLPFLVLDLVISSVLLSMGMMMLPPAMVSLPFKLLLFVLVDGWSLLAGSLVAGIR